MNQTAFPHRCFAIEDRVHDETVGEFASVSEAWSALERLVAIPWDQEPNCAPCISWRKCGREYEIVEFETSQRPSRELRRIAALSVSAKASAWHADRTVIFERFEFEPHAHQERK